MKQWYALYVLLLSNVWYCCQIEILFVIKNQHVYVYTPFVIWVPKRHGTDSFPGIFQSAHGKDKNPAFLMTDGNEWASSNTD